MMMISNTGHKRKSTSSDNNRVTSSTNNNIMSTMTKRFRGIAYDGKNNEQRMSLLSNAATSLSNVKSEQSNKKMIMPVIVNGGSSSSGQHQNSYRKLDEKEMTPLILAEYRRLQHELQCQEAMLVLMQKLKANQRLISTTNNNNNNNNNNGSNNVKQRPAVVNATKLSVQNHQQQQQSLVDSKSQLTATKQSQHQSSNSLPRSIPSKTVHGNQYTANRSNNQSQQIPPSKNLVAPLQATRQSNSNTPPAVATRISSTIPSSKSSSSLTSNSSSKTNGIAAEQHLLNAKLALRKQLEQTLLQIPTPKPSTCDLTFMPGVNGWSEFLAMLGLEQALHSYTDIFSRRPSSDIVMNSPYICAQCGTDWSVTWHDMGKISDTTTTTTINFEDNNKILCDRCTKTSQKKLLKQDHSNRLRQAFIKALQQEKELDAKFQQQTLTTNSTNNNNNNNNNNLTTTTTITPTSSSGISNSTNTVVKQQQQQHHSKHLQSTKHSNKPLSTKTTSNHHNSSSSSSNNHHHHTGKSSNHSSSSSSSKVHSSNSSLSALAAAPSPADALASTLAALQSTEQMEFFQKHFLSNMLPFAVANQAALAAKTVQQQQQQQQQQQALAASLPAMAAAVMRQQNPAQYLLDMIPQAAKHHHHHHHHSK